ncbi:MAG: methylenetetrahydrofolate--tRNA-(uracil(54)-C(5))-methyltransferase (FADH(2)-oxidizing) TrmFO [Deltaproteobacteria bacterium HGW-Deltaproteobacteria-13]|jgi:methylenetetrahydrofolate--tRNA-(uracil-5-)-methyltransferase|nr:MAG: methylenetetrahydrofolate--tRNA-(uracil(54)-C(5))-methyltransferase (FADH(2)-oxidizing) TrmFO [Deltaproteobacteria bacterium HGW-Deltaproteobacteria-13]
MTKASVTIIGGGLAGCEAAWQLLRRGHAVHLYEMKPQKFSPAHKMENLAELVCSNSLKSNSLDNATGLLKEEMRRLHSLIIMAADRTQVAAGSALAVDRLQFATEIETQLKREKNFTLDRVEVTKIPEDSLTIIATGPLTSDAMAQEIARMLDSAYLYFYDAIAPIIEADSIDMDKVFWASRYDKGTPDYLNCPLSREEYERFRQELLLGEKVAAKPFEEVRHFESCLPVEVLASRGENSLAFGPMKPVGLINPKTGSMAYAVVQLRRENTAGTLFNLVGFQTKLTWPEQRRIFRLIPGLQNAQFARYGSIHRNTYIHSPSLLLPSLQLKTNENVFFAGQITGVEGYTESAAMGILAGLNAAFILEGKKLQPPPVHTALGALLHYIVSPESADRFQPMNINFGLLNTLHAKKIRKKEKNIILVNQALQALNDWIAGQNPA